MSVLNSAAPLTPAPPLTTVTPAMALTMVESSRRKLYDPERGAVGIRGLLTEPELRLIDADGRPVLVAFAGSVLAARELLSRQRPGEWFVLVTDRDEDDLGAGVLASLIGQRLRSPDPWQAVRQRFRARTVDALLAASPGHRDIAYGLLEALPPGGWPAAPGGGLTREHAYGFLARQLLDLPPGTVDLVTVIGWSSRPGLTERWAALRSRSGDALADAVADWVASTCGPAAAAVAALLAHGRFAELAPLGLVVSVLDAEGADPAQAALVLAHLAHRWGGPDARVADAVRVLAAQAPLVVATLLADARTRPDAERVIAQADLIAIQAGAERQASASLLLRAGLTRRYAVLAELLRGAPVERAAEVEQAYARLLEHALAEADGRRPAFDGAVRLVRWLAAPAETPPAGGGSRLGWLTLRQVHQDSWVDAAVNDVAAGVDPELGDGLATVLELVRVVRDAHDVEFARALAAATADEEGADTGMLESGDAPVWLLESLLPELVLPLARSRPTLLLVLDGLSTGVASELIEDIQAGGGWQELLPTGADRRGAGLAVLPTVTEFSRASLLCGTLVTGQQAVERRGYAELTRAHGVAAALFHKKELDSSRAGFSLADDVRAAVDDTAGRPLVSCVLNTIDDALDRSDPAGTPWSIDLVKHLRPLLERARTTSRTVVITADHGHVVERRLTRQRSQPDGERKTRYRAPTSVVADDEVLVAGPRVLVEGGRAVLAVDERLRYGPLKAGYHGGASPAEAVVPVVLLVPAEQASDVSLRLAPPQQPGWWSPPSTLAPPPMRIEPAEMVAASRSTPPPTLFDETPEPVGASRGSERGPSLGRAVVTSAVYAEQRRIAGRLAVDDEQVVRVLDVLAGSDHRLSPEALAVTLALNVTRIRGAVEQLARLLNVEGYPVLVRDPSTGAVRLDETLARDQFELPPATGAR